jgi:hypothetical protein
MESQRSLSVTSRALAKLWREIAVYLELWDLIRQGGSRAAA